MRCMVMEYTTAQLTSFPSTSKCFKINETLLTNCAAGKLEGLWSNVDSELYKLAIYGGYVAAGFFIAQFVFLILFAEAVKHFETRRPHPRGARCVPGMHAAA